MPIGYIAVPESFWQRPFRYAWHGLLRLLSRYSRGADLVPPPAAMSGFRRAQRLANDTVVSVAKQLQPGMTEIEAAALLQDYLQAHGSTRYLHRAFAWFGNHARFDEYQSYDDYHPSTRALQADDTVILDVAPILDGYIGDVGYSTCLSPNPELNLAREFLLELRRDIPGLFMSDLKPADIWHEVDRRIAAAGYDNIHAKYPFCTLGHRVFRLKPKTGKERRYRVGKRFFGWFSVDTNLAFLKFGPAVTINADNIGKKVGLWAIEPHIGWPGGGAKFEEILVVESGRCYWLDDDVPHVVEARASA